ncbi:hypothetical protein AVEN_82595-1 [Araneus ventricosus]|uniref:Uncharacterized protein n=1 Tax=Araneus ventricosus TaxID=182803 RepID=A0A4Y2CSM8_ARAVE|nr:hypothetical protein AVEN_82595-1 [Araneus ventricosus]
MILRGRIIGRLECGRTSWKYPKNLESPRVSLECQKKQILSTDQTCLVSSWYDSQGRPCTDALKAHLVHMLVGLSDVFLLITQLTVASAIEPGVERYACRTPQRWFCVMFSMRVQLRFASRFSPDF